ncbi:MAG: DUF433 domain-containing protein [Acidobacteriota bacterium]|nr:DUF433 domain-containing protein [Acidobacteriota bacterium]
MTLETTQKVPLTFWEDGSIRLRGTRLLLDMIVGAHQRGDCPEEIFEAFPSNEYTVADIYAVLAYYLSHKEKIDNHLAKREAKAEAIWGKIESDPIHQDRINELKKYRKNPQV